jgi:hypothetical protein
MRPRADVMIAITRKVRSWKATQRKAACRLDISQPGSASCSRARPADALMVLGSRVDQVVLRDTATSRNAAAWDCTFIPGKIKPLQPSGFAIALATCQSWSRLFAKALFQETGGQATRILWGQSSLFCSIELIAIEAATAHYPLRKPLREDQPFLLAGPILQVPLSGVPTTLTQKCDTAAHL